MTWTHETAASDSGGDDREESQAAENGADVVDAAVADEVEDVADEVEDVADEVEPFEADDAEVIGADDAEAVGAAGAVDDEADDGPEDGNRVLAPVANAVLGHIARSIVDDPDAVEIETIPVRSNKVRLAVRVAPNDFGRLIGRRGRVAAAVRTLVGAAAVRDGLDVEVEFVE